MAVTSNRTTTIVFTGDIVGTQTLPALANVASPGDVDILTLASGFNQIDKPAGGSTVVAATIIPPAGNTTSITLKGVTGDTGLRIHNTDPTTIAIDSSVASIGLTAASTVTGVRIIWT